MNVLAIDPVPTLSRGGQEKSLFEVLGALRKKGHDVILAYLTPGDLLPQYESNAIKTVQIADSKLSRGRLGSAGHLLSSLHTLARLKVDVVYVNQVDDLPLAALVKLIRGGRLVCHLRVPPPVPSSILTSKLKQVGLSARLVDTFIVATNKSLQNYVAAGLPERKIAVIPNGFLVEKYSKLQPKSSGPVRNITYLGRIDKQKGIHDLIDAFNEMLPQHPLFHLNIGGTPTRPEQYSYLDALKIKVQEYGLEHKISFLGQVHAPVEYLATQDLCIFPSVRDESFGRVVVESLLAHTPVICRDIGSIREITDDPGGEWVFHDIDGLIGAIRRYVRDPDAYNLEERRHSVIRKYDIRNVISEIERVLSPT